MVIGNLLPHVFSPVNFETQNVERKVLSILKVLSNQQESAGSSKIARHLKDYGVNLTDSSIRYHLRMMDESGLTRLVGNRVGRGRLAIPFQGNRHTAGKAIPEIERYSDNRKPSGGFIKIYCNKLLSINRRGNQK